MNVKWQKASWDFISFLCTDTTSHFLSNSLSDDILKKINVTVVHFVWITKFIFSLSSSSSSGSLCFNPVSTALLYFTIFKLRFQFNSHSIYTNLLIYCLNKLPEHWHLESKRKRKKRKQRKFRKKMWSFILRINFDVDERIERRKTSKK